MDWAYLVMFLLSSATLVTLFLICMECRWKQRLQDTANFIQTMGEPMMEMDTYLDKSVKENAEDDQLYLSDEYKDAI